VVSHRDATCAVTTTLSVADLGECELGQRLSLPQMVVDGAAQVSHTWCARLVCSEFEATTSSAWGGSGRVEGNGISRRRGSRLTGRCRYFGSVGGRGICAAGEGVGRGAEQALSLPPGLLLP
jgi:hypothetical protein